MPIPNYGVLRCKAIARKREEGGDTPHYQVHVRAAGTDYRLAVNARSQTNPPDLLFVVEEDFQHSITVQLGELKEGFSPLPSKPGGVALDFIRANLLKRTEMVPLPDHDLEDHLDHFIQRAIDEADARVYAFGQHWGPEQAADKVFHFKPGNGIHDIHMNQGNAGKFKSDDGVWQDGGLILHFSTPRSQWVALFMAFQSQAWHTDDHTGHALAEVVPPVPGPIPGPGEPDFRVRIIAALVNPTGPAPERESVTLLNASPKQVNLDGWSLADSQKRKAPVAGTLRPGATLAVPLPPTVQLGNKGGIITLLDDRGLKVDGVSYTEQDASREGWSVVF